MSVRSPLIKSFYTFVRFTNKLTEFTNRITILNDAMIDYFNIYLHEMDRVYIGK